jgi:hypothetical protein
VKETTIVPWAHMESPIKIRLTKEERKEKSKDMGNPLLGKENGEKIMEKCENLDKS